jgi:HEAT repeat protein
VSRSLAFTLALSLALAAPALAGKPQDEIPKLVKKLAKDRDPEVRAAAAERLGDLKAKEAIPDLVRAMQIDTDASVRADAAGALLHLGEDARSAMPALQYALGDADSTVVWNAAAALHNLDVVTTDLMPAYRRLLTDRDCGIKVSAALAIAEYASAKDLRDAGRACEQAEDSDARSGAAELLRLAAKKK